MKAIKFTLSFFVMVNLLVSSANAYTPPPASSVVLFLRQKAIEITLPPRSILNPQGIRFAGQIFNFDTNQSSETLEGNGFRITKTLRSHTNGQTVDNYYLIRISNFDKRTDPFDLRLVFAGDPVPKVQINDLEEYLKTVSNHPTARLSNSGCQIGGVKSHICLQTITKVTVPGASRNISLYQTVPVRGIFVEGGIASPGQIANVYVTNPGSLVFGGQITNVEGGTQLLNYMSNATQIQWSTVRPKLNDLYARGLAAAMHNNSNSLSGTINLNAPNVDFSGTPTSFSSPPEGKLWHHSDTVVFGEVNFQGRGTILVEGGLQIQGNINCATGTRLGIMVKGNISIAQNVTQIGCGILAAISGDSAISFNSPNPQGERNFTGIFIAGNSIELPDPNNLHFPLFIKYDAVAANNPPVLFRELLRILGLTSAP